MLERRTGHNLDPQLKRSGLSAPPRNKIPANQPAQETLPPERAKPKTRRVGSTTAGTTTEITVIHQEAPQKRKLHQRHTSYSELLIRIAPASPIEVVCIAGIIVGTVYYIATKDQWLLLTFLSAAGVQGAKDLAHTGIKRLGRKQPEEL